MSAPAFTPGPWAIIPEVEYDGEDDELVGGIVEFASIEGADGNPVCTFGCALGSGTIFENAANRHLIAVAPQMLEALCQYRDDLRYPPEGESRARRLERVLDLIAKARGEA